MVLLVVLLMVMEERKGQASYCVGAVYLGSSSRSRVCALTLWFVSANSLMRTIAKRVAKGYDRDAAALKICLMTAKGEEADSTGSALSVRLGSDWWVGSFFPLPWRPARFWQLRLRSPRDQDAGLPDNVNEGENNTDEEELHKVARDQQLL